MKFLFEYFVFFIGMKKMVLGKKKDGRKREKEEELK